MCVFVCVCMCGRVRARACACVRVRARACACVRVRACACVRVRAYILDTRIYRPHKHVLIHPMQRVPHEGRAQPPRFQQVLEGKQVFAFLSVLRARRPAPVQKFAEQQKVGENNPGHRVCG